MTILDPRISRPHPHRSGFRVAVKTPAGWKHGPTRPTPEEAVAAAVAKLAALDTARANDAAAPAQVPDPAQEPDPSSNPDPLHADDPPRWDVSTVRILGPYAEAGGFRCKIKIGTEQRSAPMARTEKEALRQAERMAQDQAKLGGILIQGAIDALVDHKRQGGARPPTLEGTRRGLERFFAGMLHSPVSRVTERSAQ
jgi:hypothetical protein